MNKIQCTVVTPVGRYRELETEILNIKTIDGQRGILPNHVPTVLVLDIGKMVIVNDGKREDYAVGGGIVYFDDNHAKILVDSIESQEEINVKRAEEAKERAMRRLESKDENIDIRRAEISLKKAINRINVKKGF